MISYLRNIFTFFLISTINLFAEFSFTNPELTPPGISPNLTEIEDGSWSVGAQLATDSTGTYVYALWKYDPSNYVATAVIQTARSTDSGKTWTYPISTPTGNSPTLSVEGNFNSIGYNFHIVTDSTGQYVCATWLMTIGSYYVIQVATSLDYGMTWNYPNSTPTDPLNPNPNLTPLNGYCYAPQIVTDSTYIYVTWYKYVNSTIQTIQVARSSDHGMSWEGPYPSSATTINAYDPQIATDGTNVYSIWYKKNTLSPFYRTIEVARSTTFGVSWDSSIPLTSGNIYSNAPQIAVGSNFQHAIWAISSTSSITYGIIQVGRSTDGGQSWETPVISLTTSGNSIYQDIVTDDTGQYVYAIWTIRSSGDPSTGGTVQVARSADGGQSWKAVYSLTDDELSTRPQIITDSTGRHVYAIWQQLSGSVYIVKVALSSDYGETWVYPDSTPVSDYPTENLTAADFNATYPQIVTDRTGQYVYAAWHKRNLYGYSIQVANGLESFLDVWYKMRKTDLLLQKDCVNELNWNSILAAREYRIYLNSVSASNLIYAGNRLKYFDHGASYPSTYYVMWIDILGNEREVEEILIP